MDVAADDSGAKSVSRGGHGRINGRFDFYYPYEASQVPLFEHIGVRAKHHRVFESGHLPLERSEIIKESLDWLDRYLGKVKQ